MEEKVAYVVIEHYGSYEDKYQSVYGVTLDLEKAEALKKESTDTHKKKPESELPMTWEKFGELQEIYYDKLEEFNDDEDALKKSGWCFEDCSMDDFHMMDELYDEYFFNDYVCTTIIQTGLY